MHSTLQNTLHETASETCEQRTDECVNIHQSTGARVGRLCVFTMLMHYAVYDYYPKEGKDKAEALL